MVRAIKFIPEKLLYVLAGGLICILAAYGMAGSSTESRAQDTPKLEQFVFSDKTSSAYALTKAKGAYNNYLNSIGLPDENSIDGFARYVPLRQGGNKFIGLQILGEFGTSCPALGCETLIFEEISGGDSRLVMHIFAHHVWLEENITTDAPANIYIQSNYSGPGEVTPDGSVDVWEWNKETAKYEFGQKFE